MKKRFLTKEEKQIQKLAIVSELQAYDIAKLRVLAKRSHVDPDRLYAIKLGKVQMSDKALRKLSKGLQVTRRFLWWEDQRLNTRIAEGA